MRRLSKPRKPKTPDQSAPDKPSRPGLPRELLGDWNDLDRAALKNQEPKWRNRNAILRSSWSNLASLLPDYLEQCTGGSVLDVSCGNGACLEIMRHLGYEIQGVDYYHHRNDDLRLYLASQSIPCIQHDCKTLPIPVEDAGHDVVLSFGAMQCYVAKGDDHSVVWPRVLDEFARIARSTIAVLFNVGPTFHGNVRAVRQWSHPRFELTLCRNNLFRWDATR